MLVQAAPIPPTPGHGREPVALGSQQPDQGSSASHFTVRVPLPQVGSERPIITVVPALASLSTKETMLLPRDSRESSSESLQDRSGSWARPLVAIVGFLAAACIITLGALRFAPSGEKNASSADQSTSAPQPATLSVASPPSTSLGSLTAPSEEPPKPASTVAEPASRPETVTNTRREPSSPGKAEPRPTPAPPETGTVRVTGAQSAWLVGKDQKT